MNFFLVMTSTGRGLLCPCQNGGVCSMIGSPMCTCPNGFTGIFCENSLRKNSRFVYVCSLMIILAMNGCQQIECLNEGTCYENSPDSLAAYCFCKNGFTGKFCEIGR
jgi:hypothetical protein